MYCLESIVILMYCHLKVMHRDVKQTLNEFRAGYWVTKGRSLTKKISFPCTLCKRLNGRPYAYSGHSDLPAMRFDDRVPFASTGCDYLGPLHQFMEKIVARCIKHMLYCIYVQPHVRLFWKQLIQLTLEMSCNHVLKVCVCVCVCVCGGWGGGGGR